MTYSMCPAGLYSHANASKNVGVSQSSQQGAPRTEERGEKDLLVSDRPSYGEFLVEKIT